ncbi:hypothetical protein H0H87_006328 [Tephrocybe sp. NHM501043]|nr:hypothetical protein H0H87_006328 [Tephrocybe sp. NHM501043]
MPDREDLDPDWKLDTLHNSLKIDFEKENKSDNGESDTDTDKWDVGGKGGLIQMINMAIDNGDDPHNESWVPAQLRSKKKKNSKGDDQRNTRKGQMLEVKVRTQCQYHAEITKQTTFDGYVTSKADQPKKTSAPVHVESVTPLPLMFDGNETPCITLPSKCHHVEDEDQIQSVAEADDNAEP